MPIGTQMLHPVKLLFQANRHSQNSELLITADRKEPVAWNQLGALIQKQQRNRQLVAMGFPCSSPLSLHQFRKKMGQNNVWNLNWAGKIVRLKLTICKTKTINIF